MGSVYFSRRTSLGDPPALTSLPNNLPLEQGRRRKLTSLVPIFVGSRHELREAPSSIYFIDLANAVQTSNDIWLKKVLSEGYKNLPVRDKVTGINLLHIAAKSCSESTLTILFQNHDVLNLLNETDVRGTTPLIVAAWYGNFAALKYFLALGCETTSYIRDTKKNALHCAADLTDPQLCSQLLKYNNKISFVDAVDAEGNTPLMIAVRGGSPCVSVLLMAGANYKYKNAISGRNILHVAIVFFQNEILDKLIKGLSVDSKFLSEVDSNGDTPFMLAVKSKNYTCVNILINNVSIDRLLWKSKNCIHFLIKYDYSDLLGVILAGASDVDFLELTDNKGRTPLMYAIEMQRTDYVGEILLRQKNFFYRNPISGETVLHFASNANKADILKELLHLQGVEDIIDMSDYGGRTAYEVVLAKADQRCYYAFKDSGYVTPEFFNSKKESSLFIAAESGNYDLVLNLLLSEKFIEFHNDFPSFTKLELIRAGLQARIYSSDTFIVCGETLDLHSWNRVPDQKHLFKHNIKNKNIFHACVKGENVMCLVFIYTYCIHFNDYWQQLDLPDEDGTTPLLYATKTGQGEMCKFLIQHGANLVVTNLKGQYPLMSMKEHVVNYKELFLRLLNECVVEETSKKHMGLRKGVITVSYHILCPYGEKQLVVLVKVFEVFKEGDNYDILQNPVLEYFIETKWVKLRYLIRLRLYVNILTVLCTYIYVSVTLSLHPTPLVLIPFIRIPLLVLSILSLLINIPRLFFRTISWDRRLFSTSVISSPFLSILYLHMEPNTLLKTQIGSLAVLTAGSSVFIHAIGTPLGYQISMFYEVFSRIVSHLPIGFAILLSFSLCFFVIYHDTFNFSNPINSFFFTTMVLMDGDTSDLPTFRQEHFNSNSSQLSENGVNGKKKITRTITNTIFEGFMLIWFKLLVTLALLNMLIGLSVRGASELEKGGIVQRLTSKIGVLYEWESFSYSKFYKWLSKYRLCFMFGLKPNLMESLEIPPVIYPLENPIKSFDIHKLDNLALKKEEILSHDIKFLAEEIGYHEDHSTVQPRLAVQK